MDEICIEELFEEIEEIIKKREQEEREQERIKEYIIDPEESFDESRKKIILLLKLLNAAIDDETERIKEFFNDPDTEMGFVSFIDTESAIRNYLESWRLRDQFFVRKLIECAPDQERRDHYNSRLPGWVSRLGAWLDKPY